VGAAVLPAMVEHGSLWAALQERSMLCSVQASGDPGPTYIPPQAIAIGAAVIAVNAAVSVWLQLGLHWQLAIGAVR